MNRSPRAYSGSHSIAFWRRVNRLPEQHRETVFALGVVLQEVEGRVWWALSAAEHRANLDKRSKGKSRKRQLVGSPKKKDA